MRKVMDGAQIDQEVSRAEYHLNHSRRELPQPKTVALAVVAVVLLVLTKTAGAAVNQDNCSLHLKNIKFSGTFKLKSEPLRFVIGETENSPAGTAVAQIWSGNQCQASCASIDAETGDLSVPISLDLQCRGEKLGPLSAHVAVLWDHGKEHSTLLRFGSWIEGYEQAAMKVEVDHFTAVNVASVH